MTAGKKLSWSATLQEKLYIGKMFWGRAKYIYSWQIVSGSFHGQMNEIHSEWRTLRNTKETMLVWRVHVWRERAGPCVVGWENDRFHEGQHENDRCNFWVSFDSRLTVTGGCILFTCVVLPPFHSTCPGEFFKGSHPVSFQSFLCTVQYTLYLLARPENFI